MRDVVSEYDAFFSYHWRDRDAVEAVARVLHKRGLRVFLDRSTLTPGQPWPQVLERALDSCNAVVVFLGPEGLGRWQQREKDLALARQARNPAFPVIPVLLPDADPPLGFLQLNTWVDLRSGINDDVAFKILESAIRGEQPGPDLQRRIMEALAAVCPYRGLQQFREEDASFFFGREGFTDVLVATVSQRSFVAVVGASGSGKSSVVRAGLIPRLHHLDGGPVWDVVSLVPGNRPLSSLAAALIPLLEPTLSEVDRLAEINKLAGHLAAGDIALRDVSARILAKESSRNNCIVLG